MIYLRERGHVLLTGVLFALAHLQHAYSHDLPPELLRFGRSRQFQIDVPAMHRRAGIGNDVNAVIRVGAAHLDARTERQNVRIGRDDAFVRDSARRGRFRIDRKGRGLHAHHAGVPMPRMRGRGKRAQDGQNE